MKIKAFSFRTDIIRNHNKENAFIEKEITFVFESLERYNSSNIISSVQVKLFIRSFQVESKRDYRYAATSPSNYSGGIYSKGEKFTAKI